MQTWRHQWRNWCHRFSKTLLSARNDEQPPESSRPNCNHLSSVPQNREGEVPRFGRRCFHCRQNYLQKGLLVGIAPDCADGRGKFLGKEEGAERSHALDRRPPPTVS